MIHPHKFLFPIACLAVFVGLFAADRERMANQRLIEPELATPERGEPFPWVGLEAALDAGKPHTAHAPTEADQAALAVRAAAWMRAALALETAAEMGLPATEEAFLDAVDMWAWDNEHNLAHLFAESRPALLAFLQMQQANAELRIASGEPDDLAEFHLDRCDCDTHEGKPIINSSQGRYVLAWQRAADILGAIVTEELERLKR